MPLPNPETVLRQAPTRFRSSPARGLSGEAPIEHEGGDEKAGLIRGLSVITRGEALGHGRWVDGQMLAQVATAINNSEKGVKSRFTHPSLSGDGLGKHLGRVKNATVDGDVVRADLHLSKTAHETPDGDLAGYVLSLAERDPAAFGMSIAFSTDGAAEKLFQSQHTVVKDGAAVFASPDPKNTKNLRHARLAKLYAADSVDEPAANPNGLFHRAHELASDADALAEFALGLREETPELVALDLDPDRVTGFVSRFLESHGLSIVKREAGEAPEFEDVKLAEGETEPEPEEPTPPATPPTAELSAAPLTVSDGKRFLEAFGPQGGVWFAEGKTFDEARELFAANLAAENSRLRAEVERLAALAAENRGAKAPASFVSETPPNSIDPKAIPDKLAHTLKPGLARFAAGLQLPN